MEPSKSNTSTDLSLDDKTPEKRRPRCSGCKLPHEIHKLSPPGPHCTGPISTLLGSPRKDLMASKKPPVTDGAAANKELEEDPEEKQLLARLDELQVEEAALQKQRRTQRLKAIIAETEKRVSSLKSATISQVPSPVPSSGMSAMLNSAYTASQATAKTPLDNLLVGSSNGVERNKQNISGFTLGPGASPDGPLMPPQAVQESLMFLKPSQVNKGERVLRIIDFIDKLVPNTDEHTISEVGSTKLLVSFGTKKPKLDSISLAQWVIGNTRIFHTLLQLGKLPSQEDVQHYLAYTVKVMELSTRFTWASVLKYDDEFRHLQATYQYPWNYDSPHLHTVLLEPVLAHSQTKPLSKPNGSIGSGSSIFANFTQEDGIVNGFQLVPSGTHFAKAQNNNYKSATGTCVKAAVEQTILSEIREGNYVVTESKPAIVSALGAIPKPNSSEIRLIHDCSRPHGQALNDYISTHSFKFQTLDDAIAQLQPNYFMAKIDLRHAYRSVPIHPSNYAATGLQWHFDGDDDVTYFYDTRLPFGAKRSPEIFHRLTQSVRRMMARRGFNSVVVYLDDFLVIAPTREACQLAFSTLLQLLQDLGFSISWHKVIRPTQKLVFLGVELDTNNCSLSLPSSKLTELQTVISNFLNKRRANKKQLQQLAGKLNWACRVVYGGRTFLRRILDMMNTLQSTTAKVRLSSDFFEDIKWWHSFLQVFNGQRPFLSTKPITDVDTDACNLAAGAYYRGDWLYHHFLLDSPECATLHINYKEVLAQVFAAFRWGPLWENHHVIIHCDNVAAVHIINKGTTNHPLVMSFLRKLFWLSAIHNFRFTASYIKGQLNTTADAVSRLHQPDKAIAFSRLLLQYQPIQQVYSTPLVNHMSLNSGIFLLSRFTRTRACQGT
ncbi:hypothetical protein ACROYT_G039640 [Oculina patagonica]